MLQHLESTIEIDAPSDVVWDVLTDTENIIKLTRDAVSVTVDPPGRSSVGQKYHLIGKVGIGRIEVFLEVNELVPKTKVGTTQRPGGIFRSLQQSTTLEPRDGKTLASTSLDYELSMGYVGKVLNIVLVEKLVRDNLTAYSLTLKELSELPPPPGSAPLTR